MSIATAPLERRWTHEPREHLQRVIPRTGQVTRAKPGPWWDEPDKIQWVDPATDLDCLLVRNQMGVWCGYVGLPFDHPWSGAGSYDQLDVEVHGGLTFGPSLCDEDAPEGRGICHVPFPGRPADVAWIGFDCGHGFDYAPALEAMYDEIEMVTPGGGLGGLLGVDPFHSVYRDEAYARGQVASLARQAADAVRSRKRHGFVKHARDERRRKQKELVRLLAIRDRSELEDALLQVSPWRPGR